jgi:hypothetical protein
VLRGRLDVEEEVKRRVARDRTGWWWRGAVPRKEPLLLVRSLMYRVTRLLFLKTLTLRMRHSVTPESVRMTSGSSWR